MRLRDLFRRPAPAPDPAPHAAPATRPEWPDLPPMQRVVSAPSLVTAPDRFQQGLASWANPSFLVTPGHLVSPDAPSGSVAGLSRPAVSWDRPFASGWPDAGAPDGATDGATDDGPSAESVPEPAPESPSIQRTVTAPLPLRRLPAAPAPRVPGGTDLVSAGTTPVPAPVWRPALPAEASARDAPATRSDGATPAVAPLPALSQAEAPQAEAPQVEAPQVEAPQVEISQVEESAETVVPVTSQAPLPVQAVVESPAAPADPLPAPRRRLGLGAPLPIASVPAGTPPTGPSAVVARLLEGPAQAAPQTAPSTRRLEPTPAPPSAATVAEEPPITPVQRHAADEEAPLVGATPIALPPSDDVPVQRDSAAAPAPATFAALPPPARETTSTEEAPLVGTTPLALSPSVDVPVQRDNAAATGAPAPPAREIAAAEQAPLVGATPIALPPSDDVPVQRESAAGPAPATFAALPRPPAQSATTEEAPLVGTIPPTPEPTEAAPVQRTHASAEMQAMSVPAVGSVLPRPAGQSTTSAQSWLPAGPSVQRTAAALETPHAAIPRPVAAASVPRAAEAVVGLPAERPLVARAAEPSVLGGRTVEQQHERLPSPVVQRMTRAEPAHPHERRDSGEAGEASLLVPGPGSVPWEAALIGERPIAQRLPEPAPDPVPSLGERPIVLRAVVPSPVRPAVGMPSTVPALQRLARPDAAPPLLAVQALPRAHGAEPASEVSAPSPRSADADAVVVSRLSAGAPDAPAPEVAAPPPAAGGPPTGTPPPSGAAPSPTAVDALVHRLFDPLSVQFKAELRLDRERVGHALDLRY